MRLLILTLLCALFLCATSCPPDDEQISKVFGPLVEKFNKDICGQGIKPGGQGDLDFLNNIILPYYLNKKWLTKEPPSGWEKERDKVFAKCYNNAYNYCDEGLLKNFGNCVKGLVGGLLLKYGSTALSYCPILDSKVEKWETSGDKAQAFEFFTQYCKTKGK